MSGAEFHLDPKITQRIELSERSLTEAMEQRTNDILEKVSNDQVTLQQA